MKNLSQFICAFMLLALSSCSSDWNNNEPVGLDRTLIAQGSPLFELIQKVTVDGNDPMAEIVCIDFKL